MFLRLLDLDGSLRGQKELWRRALTEGEIVDLQHQAGDLRLWASRSAMRRYAIELANHLRPLSGPEVTFIGSGDFHHLIVPLIGRTPGPLTVLHFDNHPDWAKWGPAYHCGGWVNRVLELPNVTRVITLGCCSGDLSRPQLRGGALGWLKSGQLEVHPWDHPASRIWGRMTEGPGHLVRGGRIVWNCLAGQNWDGFLLDLVSRLPTERVWITIDKDVLSPDYATTNWDQGKMTLAHLVSAIKVIGRRLAGLDVCGDRSVLRHANILKRIESWIDQPLGQPSGAAEAHDYLNEAANLALLAAVEP